MTSDEIKARLLEQKEVVGNDLDFIKEHIEASEIESIGLHLGISNATIYSYLGGKRSNYPTAKAISDEGFAHLKIRGIYKEDIL